MPIVIPAPIPALSTALPDPSDRTTYGPRGRAVWDWEVNQAAPGINAQAAATLSNAQHAQAMAEQAQALANFKGAWAGLTGALAKPASAHHATVGGDYWVLLTTVTDVTAHVPGVSAAWVPYSGGGTAAELVYDPAASGLLATDVQAALDELAGRGVPAGAVEYFASSTAPAGWLKANGSAVSVTAYADLDTAIYVGDALNPTADWGYRCTDALNPTTTRSTTGGYIVLPDGRGEFFRGWDDARGVDVDRAWASKQGATATLQKIMAWGDYQFNNSAVQVGLGQDYANADTETSSIAANFPAGAKNAAGGVVNPTNEADNVALGGHSITQDPTSLGRWITHRPRNLALLACIKY